MDIPIGMGFEAMSWVWVWVQILIGFLGMNAYFAPFRKMKGYRGHNVCLLSLGSLQTTFSHFAKKKIERYIMRYSASPCISK